MKAQALLVLMVLLISGYTGSSFAMDFLGEDSKGDLAKFQGKWTLLQGEHDGKTISDAHTAKSTISFDGETATIVTPHQHSEPIVAEIVKIDTTKNPMQMHVVRKNGPGTGKILVAVYQFDGNEICHFALDPTAITTPNKLEAKENTGHIKHTWKRAH